MLNFQTKNSYKFLNQLKLNGKFQTIFSKILVKFCFFIGKKKYCIFLIGFFLKYSSLTDGLGQALMHATNSTY